MSKPVILGALMGPVMMWMLHGALTGNTLSAAALAAFVGAHVALILVAVAAIIHFGVHGLEGAPWI